MAKIQTRLARQALPDRIAYRVVRDLVTVICRVWCRMTIEGRHHIPKSGVFIVASIVVPLLGNGMGSQYCDDGCSMGVIGRHIHEGAA